MTNSKTSFSITRRSALMGAAALPVAAATTSPAFAAAEMLGIEATRANRFKVGDFEVTTLLAGTRTVPEPHAIFGLNASEEAFAEASAEANIPTDKAQFFFTPTVVNTGEELILFDTGLNPGLISGALKKAGYSPDQIDKVVLTHMHGDHIGGMADGGTSTFANAAYLTGSTEFDAWDMSGNEGFEAKVRPFAENMTMLEDGGSVASGVTAMAAFGHTPGHMAYMLESGGESLVLGADFANHYVWSLAHPDWEVKFDRDKEMAAKTRRRMLDMMAADKVPFVGYHMPWPGVGFVEKSGDGYAYVPASYQLMLD